MTADLVRRAGRAFARFLRLHVGQRRLRILLARDSRPSGELLLRVLADAMILSDCDVTCGGIISTPCAARFVRKIAADGGIVLTASHNPAEYNGIKFLTADGAAPDEPAARRILALFEEQPQVDEPAVKRHESSCALHAHDVDPQAHDLAVHDHVAAVLATVDRTHIASRKFRIVLDSVNGAGGEEAAALLTALGCELIHMNAPSTGRFPHPPEPIEDNLRDLAAAVVQHGASAGFAQDPDADRLAIVDEHGRYIGEEYTIALAVMNILSERPGAVVANLSTSRMVDDVAGRVAGCRVERSAVGEANVVALMRRIGAVVGGEGNGGVIDPRIGWVRDSLVAMAQTLALMAARGVGLSELVADVPHYHMVKTKIPAPADGVQPLLARVRDRFRAARICDADGIRVDLDDAWVHVRGSNTEPIVRIIAEARSAPAAAALVDEVRALAMP